MWAFLTFSSPHLGYLYNNSKLIQTGWKKNLYIDEINYKDFEYWINEKN